ncbi:hypothetical protein HOC54_02865 [Candidatus Peregrinibacteria bacterium]|jgi:hypothetical protein|nr:hypothetical protein [Candidatus Peregrinibacteria bacterium]
MINFVGTNIVGNEVRLISSGMPICITRQNANQLLDMLLLDRQRGNLDVDEESILKSIEDNRNG